MLLMHCDKMDFPYDSDPSWSESAPSLSFSPIDDLLYHPDFHNPQDLPATYTEFPASNGLFEQYDGQSTKRAAASELQNEQHSNKRARNTQAARRCRERKREAMALLQNENRVLCAQLKEAQDALAVAQVGNSNTNLRLPPYPAAITTPDIASNSVEDSLISGDGRRLGLDEEDLKCLEPGSPLTDKVINAVLRLLGSLAPLTIITIDSSADDITLSEWLQPVDKNISQTILIPIHILPSGHWLLVVRDSNGARLLDSLPTDDHKRFAKERIVVLFHTQSCWPDPESMEEIRYPQEIDSVDSGVAILYNAIYTVAISLGGVQELPQFFDATIWREALMLLLRAAMGQTYHLSWAEALGGDAVSLSAPHTSDEAPQLLWSPSVSPISYQDAIRTIEYQQHILSHQRERLEAAVVEKNEKITAAARQGRYIRGILEGLSIQPPCSWNRSKGFRERGRIAKVDSNCLPNGMSYRGRLYSLGRIRPKTPDSILCRNI